MPAKLRALIMAPTRELALQVWALPRVGDGGDFMEEGCSCAGADACHGAGHGAHTAPLPPSRTGALAPALKREPAPSPTPSPPTPTPFISARCSQVCSHLQAVGKICGVRAAAIVGGIAQARGLGV